jgi:hypothetical protein
VLFAQDTAPARADVPAVGFHQPLPGNPSQPGVERQRLLPQIIRELSSGLGQRVLHQVGGVQAGGQPAVQAQGHHAPQPRPVVFQQLLPSGRVSLRRLAQQLLGVGR